LQTTNTAVFTDTTIAQILALTSSSTDTVVKVDTGVVSSTGTVTFAAGTELGFVSQINPTVPVTVAAEAPVLALQGITGVNATIVDAPNAAPSPVGEVDRVIITSAGADNLVINSVLNTQVTLGQGDTVQLGGSGNDTVVAGLGNSTVVGGTGSTGIDIVKINGVTNGDAVPVTVGPNGTVTIVTNGSATTIQKIQYVALDDGKALVFAKDTAQAQVTTLYETTFGKTADAATLKSLFDQQAAGKSLQEIAASLTASTEFKLANDNLNNADFVNALYMKTFGRAGEAAGMNFWTAALNGNHATRAEMVAEFAKIAGHSIDGTSANIEAQVVGSVTIVHNII
jgi:hypothetical protein